MYNSEEYIQNVLNLYCAINRRHGVMVIGQPVTGKTTIIKLLLEVINEINAIELKTHLFNF
jgi:type IV secretory pathway ATPase VirB11/archaellum biosynthesis ATPase